MKYPIVTFQTTAGTFKAELYPEIAPNTVNNFVSLVWEGFLRRHHLPSGHPRFYDPGRRPRKAAEWAAPAMALKGEFSGKRIQK